MKPSNRWKTIVLIAAITGLVLFLNEVRPLPTIAGTTPAGDSDFKYLVQYEQGATKFLKGDNITITEVHGTADNFSRGNIYVIKGTYTLTSHDKATLAAYTTAMESKDAVSTPLKVQLSAIDKGHGTFTLFLPMICRGWPHVSFYDEKEGFGGNYFGTGESVLKEWWGEQPKNKN